MANVLDIVVRVIDQALAPLRLINNAMQGLVDNQKQAGVEAGKATKKFRGFRFEFLSVMFAGMALSSVMMGLLQPAMNAAGIFDVWGATLQLLFLPIALTILDFFISLLTAVDGLPEPVKLLIGAIALLGAILGTLLITIGTVVLAVMGIGAAFGGASTWAAGMAVIGNAIAGIVAVVLSPIGALIAIIAFLYLAWANNWNGMRDIVNDIFTSILGIITSVINMILIVFDTFIKVITGDWEGAWDNLGKLFDVFWNGFLGNIASLSFDILKAFYAIGKSIIDGLVQGITGIGSVIWNAILGIVPEPGKSILQGIGNFVGGAANFVGGIAKGVGDFFGGMLGGLPHFAEGGFTGNYSGMAMLHPNEFIIPADKMDQFSPNTTINVYTTGGVDADALFSRWEMGMRQQLRGRTIS